MPESTGMGTGDATQAALSDSILHVGVRSDLNTDPPKIPQTRCPKYSSKVRVQTHSPFHARGKKIHLAKLDQLNS